MSNILYAKYEEFAGLNSRVVLSLNFRIEYPLHVGEKQEGVIKRIIRFNVNGRYIPIIPAESFKGAFRSLATKIAKEIFTRDKFHDVKEIVKTHNKDEHFENFSKELIEKIYREAKNWVINNSIISRDKIEEISKRDIVETYLSFKCPICRLLGSKVLASKIIFRDILFDKDPEIYTYTSISINRSSKIVEEKRLYQVEYIPPENKYILSTEIIIDNVEPGSYEGILLANILSYILKFGLTVGGAKSKGYGLIRLRGESKAIILNLVKPRDVNDLNLVINNVKALLMKKEAIKIINIDEYIKYLSS